MPAFFGTGYQVPFNFIVFRDAVCEFFHTGFDICFMIFSYAPELYFQIKPPTPKGEL
jgi:hypothetical protein